MIFFLILVFGCFSSIECALIPLRFLTKEPPPPQRSRDADMKAISTNYTTRKLDNFNPDSDSTFEMRYLTNDQFFKPNGPIFIMLGGEWRINSYFLTGGHMFELGRDLGAFLMYTEHRYYGLTKPTPNITSENLQWLSVDQALKDVVELVKELKSTDSFSASKVVVFGGSYAGNMATWIRLKYPEVIDGAVASSGPVLAKSDFYEYLETVGDSMKTYGGQQCYDTIEEGIKEAEDMLKTPEGTKNLSELIGLCKTVNTSNSLDVMNFFSIFIDAYSGLVQYGTPDSIKYVCKKMEDGGQTSLEKVASFINATFGRSDCLDIEYELYVQEYSNTNYSGSAVTGRLWLYQTCNEFGYYQTTTSDKQPFGKNLPLSFYSEHFCSDIFGSKFGTKSIDDGVQHINKVYGGLKPDVTKVFTVHGSIDPWHRLGILEDLSDESPAMLIDGSSHCKDLLGSSVNDRENMMFTRAKVRAHVTKWVLG